MSKPELKSVIGEDETDPVVEAISTSAPDPFDLSSLRLDQTFAEGASVKKLLTTVPVRSPNPQEFIRVHPGTNYRATLAILKMKASGETFLLTPNVANELPQEYKSMTVFTATYRQGVVFLWPVRQPSSDGRTDLWATSANDAASRATKLWVRVKPNMLLGAYETEVPGSTLDEPAWPDLPFQELLRLGFRDGRLVNSLDHPVVKQLRGL